MVGFAFALVIVFVMIIRLAGEGISSAAYDGRRSFAKRRIDMLKDKLAPTEQELEEARRSDDYSDIIEDLAYIVGCDVSELNTYDYVRGVDSRHIVTCIRLSKIGKYEYGINEILGIKASKTSTETTPESTRPYRYFEVIAKNLNQFGFDVKAAYREDRLTISPRESILEGWRFYLDKFMSY